MMAFFLKRNPGLEPRSGHGFRTCKGIIVFSPIAKLSAKVNYRDPCSVPLVVCVGGVAVEAVEQQEGQAGPQPKHGGELFGSIVVCVGVQLELWVSTAAPPTSECRLKTSFPFARSV